MEEHQNQLEQNSVAMVKRMEAQYTQNGNFTVVEHALLDNAAAIVSSLWSLSDEILFKYASGFVAQIYSRGTFWQLIPKTFCVFC